MLSLLNWDPTVIRSTATGFLSAINRIGAVTGVNLFAVFITASPVVPILIVAALLGISGLISLFLPRVEKQSFEVILSECMSCYLFIN